MDEREIRDRAQMLIAVFRYLAAELDLSPAPPPVQIATTVSAEGVRRGLLKTMHEGDLLLIGLTEKGQQLAVALLAARAKMN